MKDFWNERYANEVYAYGTQPNAYFNETIKKYSIKGHLLLPAEGEGRNAVYAAKQGLSVTAFDISHEGQRKALKLAEEHQVRIKYKVGALQELDFTRQKFDAIALIYAHFAADKLSDYHKELVTLLKPGGLMILEGFSKNHLELQKINPQAGGPKNIDMLFSVEGIQSDFAELEALELSEEEVTLSEGPFHKGLSRVIRFVGRKNS